MKLNPLNYNCSTRVALSLPLFISEDQNEAELKGDKYLLEYISVWASAADSWKNISSNNYPGYTGMGYALRQNSSQHMRNTNQAIIGTPNYVANKIDEIKKLTNVDQILWQIDFGGQRLDSMMNTLLLFTNKVLPLLKKMENS